MGDYNYAMCADIHLVNNIKLNIKSGTVTYISGPIHSGKTKLIKILSNVVENNDSVQFFGLDWENNDVEIKRKVSFVYEYCNFNINTKPNKIAKGIMALEENFNYQYFSEKMDAHHLEWKKKIKKYSEENMFIFNIIIALSRQPEILIIDEPFDSLDFEFREAVFELLSEFMQQEKHTILFTHDSSIEDIRDENSVLSPYYEYASRIYHFSDHIIDLESGQEVINTQTRREYRNVQYQNENSVNCLKEKPQGFISKLHSISKMYVMYGSSRKEDENGDWFLLMFGVSILYVFLVDYYKFLDYIILVTISTINLLNNAFKDKSNLLLSLSISRKKHIKYAYLSILYYVLIYIGIIILTGIFLLHMSIIDTLDLRTFTTVYTIFTVYFLYVPLSFIVDKKIWWCWSAIATVVFFGINYTLNHIIFNLLGFLIEIACFIIVYISLKASDYYFRTQYYK